jgi:hypothetical protein
MGDFGTCASKQGHSCLVSIMFVVAISKIPSQAVEEVTTLVMMMMMVVVVVMVVMMLMMMYITIPSSHLPLENCQKCLVHIQIWFPVQAKKFVPKSYTQVSVFFFWQNFFAQLD